MVDAAERTSRRARHPWAAHELVVLGTSAQTPTLARNQTGHVVRWGREVVLFDPGEGTQRQLLRAGVSVAQLTRICITHAHGDHCLGLAGLLQRRALDATPAPLDVHVPASMVGFVDAAMRSSAWDPSRYELRVHATRDGDVAALAGGATLHAAALDHTVDTLGWRIELAAAQHLLPDRLVARGVPTGAREALRRDGLWCDAAGGEVRLAEVSEPAPGAAFAFVMDTRPCAAAVALARNADLAVFEATYLEAESALAAAHGHSTARQAAAMAAQAEVGRLVLSHYSARYVDEDAFAREAASEHPAAHAARDLDVVRAPARRRRGR